MKKTHAFSIATATAVYVVLAGSVLSAVAAESARTYQFRSQRKPGDVDRVVGLVEVGGQLKEIAKEKVQSMTMDVECSFSYDEKTLEVPVGAAGRWRAVRDYDKLDAVIKIEDETLKPQLRSQRRLIGVAVEPPSATLFSPEGPLSRDELDLIDVAANTLLWDELLPSRPVAIGETWGHSDKLIVALLGLDAVKRNEARSVLKEVTDRVARMELSGRIEGAVNGVTTEIELLGKYRVDLSRKRIDWLGLLVKENRSIGHVERGVEAVTRLQVTVTSKGESPRLADAVLADLSLEPTDALSRLIYQSPEGAWQVATDRRWYVVGGQRDRSVLRMVDQGELVAQCNVSSLPKLQPGQQLDLPEFQADVQAALGESFGEFVETGQWANEADYRVFRVVVRGEAETLPIQWKYYLVADEQGHQAAFAFTVEENLVDQLGDADAALVRSFRFVDPKVASSTKP